MYDPFYEFFDLISVFGYVNETKWRLPPSPPILIDRCGITLCDEAVRIKHIEFDDGVYIHFVCGWIIMCVYCGNKSIGGGLLLRWAQRLTSIDQVD